MTIAVDAMGGDRAPGEIVEGTVLAAGEHPEADFLLVGDSRKIEVCLKGRTIANVAIRHTTQVIEMDDKPVEAFRRKRDSSLVVAAKIVQDGEADALVSAGNTGAAAAVSQLTWRLAEGADKPAIASMFPNKHGRFVLLDAGASPDIDPEHLIQFAHMGREFVRLILGREDPHVHLLNIGEEPGKGNAFAKRAFELLSELPWFKGNIESKAAFHEPCDVVLCDAFIGNIVLKTAEGVGEFIKDEIRASVPTGLAKILFIPMQKALEPLRRKMDYAEYGGMPLLGLNRLCVIAHGRSNAKAIKNACHMACRAVETGLVEKINSRLTEAK